MLKDEELIFVYNAKSGFFNGAMDSLHKLVSPETYECALCSITHHSFGMRKQWQDFIQQLEIPVSFKHRNDVKDEMAIGLPAILHKNNGHLDVVAGPEDIKAAGDVSGLMALVDGYLMGDKSV